VSIILVDSYGTEYYSGDSEFIGASYRTIVSQSFTGKAGNLTGCKFYLSKVGNPTGNITAKLYSHSGTFGISSLPDTLLATSDNVDITTLTGDFQDIIFNFTGAEQYLLEDDTYYCITIEYSGGNLSNFIRIQVDETTASHSGNLSRYDAFDGWVIYNTVDLIFYVYASGSEPADTADEIKSLPTPISLKTTKEVNGAWTAKMQILPDDYVDTDSYIDIDGEHYIVKKLRRIKSGGKYYFDVDLLHNAIEELSVQTVGRMSVLEDAETIMTAILDGSGWIIGTCEITDIVAFTLDKRVSKLEALTQLATKCNAELDYNSKDRTVDLKYQIGTVTGLQLRYDKNCTEIIKEEDSTDLVTRIYPYGADNYPINCTVLDDCEDEGLYTASATGSTLASDKKMYKSIGIEMASETLNETFIRDLGASNTVDLSGHDLLKFWIYSEVDNANGFDFGIGKSAYTEITVNTGTLTAKCWKEVELDLSGISDTNKDAIRYIGFKNNSNGSITAVFDFIRAFDGEEYMDSPNISLYKVPKEYVYQHSAKLERQQVTIQIYPSADAEVKQGAPNTNFGNATYLESRDEPTAAYDYMSFMKFPLTQIPTGAIVEDAKLNLYVYWLGANGSNTGVTSNVHLSGADWDESTLTWNNKPAVGALINTMSMTSIGWKTLDITDEFNDWRDGVTDNFGLRFFPSSANANRNAAWYSKEALENKPYIEVTYTILNDPKDIIKAAAQDYLYANDEPKLKYSVKAADLSKVIVDTWEDEEIALGDTVKIYDAELDLNVAVRIKKITRDILDPTDIELELVNKSYTFADEQAKIAKQLSYAMPFKDNPNIIDANAIQVGYTGSDTNA
jgi:hypothetical protein